MDYEQSVISRHSGPLLPLAPPPFLLVCSRAQAAASREGGSDRGEPMLRGEGGDTRLGTPKEEPEMIIIDSPCCAAKAATRAPSGGSEQAPGQGRCSRDASRDAAEMQPRCSRGVAAGGCEQAPRVVTQRAPVRQPYRAASARSAPETKQASRPAWPGVANSFMNNEVNIH